MLEKSVEGAMGGEEAAAMDAAVMALAVALGEAASLALAVEAQQMGPCVAEPPVRLSAAAQWVDLCRVALQSGRPAEEMQVGPSPVVLLLVELCVVQQIEGSPAAPGATPSPVALLMQHPPAALHETPSLVAFCA